jgi:hypothetical protein
VSSFQFIYFLSSFGTLQTVYIPRARSVLRCEACCLPSEAWERQVVKDFTQLRRVRCCLPAVMLICVCDTCSCHSVLVCFQTIAASLLAPRAQSMQSTAPIPSVSDAKAWKIFCFGDGAPGAPAASTDPCLTETQVTAPVAGTPGRPPLLSILIALDHVSCLTLLNRHIQRLCSCASAPPVSYTSWMYALLARTDLPLCPDTSSSLRMLLKHYCKLRAEHCARLRVGVQHSSVADGEACEAERLHDDSGLVSPDFQPRLKRHKAVPLDDANGLACINLVITLIHRVFGQMDHDLD